jgi:tetratricopeptide (TPR) repeat protein
MRIERPSAGEIPVSLLCLALALAVGAAYSFTPSCAFIGLDDSAYVYLNPHILSGTAFEQIRWAFTSFHSSNWHPLTWLSHALDVKLFGLDPSGHHLMNALLHVANTLILFLTLRGLTRDTWRSLAVAAIFGLHPLQVESVVWVASRKGLLSALFGFLAFWAYGAYARRPSGKRYSLTLGLLALSLMSKQTLVVFPFLALLLDYWPLRRFEAGLTTGERSTRRLWLDKAPMLALALAASGVTAVAQSNFGAVAPLESWSPWLRASNALAGYYGYLANTLYPHDLALLYPLSLKPPLAKAAAGALLLAIISLSAWRLRQKAGWFFTGWFWFLLALGPVIGIIQIGKQAMADRYMYIPLIGLAIVACWGAPLLLRRLPRPAAPLLALSALVALAFATYAQTLWWADEVSLYGRALAVTNANPYMEYNLAMAYKGRRQWADALPHLQEAIRLSPGFRTCHVERGHILFALGRYEEAAANIEEALRRWPDDIELRNNLGALYGKLERYAEAATQLERALALNPDDPLTKYNLAVLRKKQAEASATPAPSANP